MSQEKRELTYEGNPATIDYWGLISQLQDREQLLGEWFNTEHSQRVGMTFHTPGTFQALFTDRVEHQLKDVHFYAIPPGS